MKPRTALPVTPWKPGPSVTAKFAKFLGTVSEAYGLLTVLAPRSPITKRLHGEIKEAIRFHEERERRARG